MTVGKNIVRIMEKRDTYSVPEIRELFEEYGYRGDYFLCVIENDNQEKVGYLVARKEKEKLVVTKLHFFEDVEDKQAYRRAAFANLYQYITNIKGSEGKRMFYQVSVI